MKQTVTVYLPKQEITFVEGEELDMNNSAGTVEKIRLFPDKNYFEVVFQNQKEMIYSGLPFISSVKE